jgi:hypothetical protein
VSLSDFGRQLISRLNNRFAMGHLSSRLRKSHLALQLPRPS